MDVNDVLTKIDEVLSDHSMPRRVKTALTQIKTDLGKGDQNLDVVITSSIYTLDEITNDVNISMHAKTIIWDIISELEALKG
ncbi:MAG: hypothetical protein GF416_01805 [Candidatus Altiarchaeales archaeon]|nr:hypothetical protein [Candidatus Altiarchaeales archaeon]MBD3415851.1 hypothetical protein [Candidatus Altiarchaeales archaeon]